jgi:hypothetical protein
MIEAVRYEKAREGEWDAFVRESRNGVFLFERPYMDYHADRFEDHSLVFYRKHKPVGLLPANRDGDALVSHGGLTFGGVVAGPRATLADMTGIFETLRSHMEREGMRRLVYKAVPHIYHRVPAEEDLYLLFRNNASLVRRDVSASLRMAERPRYSKGRKWSVKKGKKNGIEVRETQDFETFMAIEAARLSEKYDATPVHTAAELQLLAGRFPKNIRLFGAYLGDRMLGGVVVYDGGRVAHAQYIGATDEGRDLCALDVVLDRLLSETFTDRTWFDFGISTEQGGRFLNESLASNKEGYGARAVVYDFYEIDWDRAPASPA